MRETPRAKQAWNDYLAMGEGRSLENLLKRYQNQAAAPTNRLPTLKDWSRKHNWQARLSEIAEQERQAIIARGIADRQNRLDLYCEIAADLLRVKAERAADPALRDVPGGSTGLLVRQAKLVKVYKSDGDEGSGQGETLYSAKRDVLVYEYAIDTSLTRELREYAKQVAIEKGEWTEKREEKHDLTDSFLQALKEFGRGSGDN